MATHDGDKPPPYSLTDPNVEGPKTYWPPTTTSSPYVPPLPPAVLPTGPSVPLVGQPVSAVHTYGATAVTVSPTEVIVVGGCPSCKIGILEDDFTCLGICCAIVFFPLGILCCLLMRQRRCANCGAVFGWTWTIAAFWTCYSNAQKGREALRQWSSTRLCTLTWGAITNYVIVFSTFLNPPFRKCFSPFFLNGL